ncbi:MAG: hypothetical protein CMD88_03850 [Gammaproteobacteria bacterium]|nr:hypothetical protein [Gammaproteobacteria bacterium]|tara:strand:+ start:180528 stop:181154 length:627 start_codon:yes stop_codon:yes gene_type:complete
MIYFVLFIILAVYLYLIFNSLNKQYLLLIAFIFLISFLFYSTSNIQDINQYRNILVKHKDIRDKISKIRENIPNLEKNLSNNPNNFDGWIILAKSYSLIEGYVQSIDAYENAISLNPNEKEIWLNYISVLTLSDEKANKNKIKIAFSKLIQLDNGDNINFYLDRLDFAIRVNEPELAISTIKDIIKHPDVIDKKKYEKVLNHILKQRK